MSHILVLVRHGQSEWNAKNLFTGWRDPDLTAQGIEEARQAGRKLKEAGFFFDTAFTSKLTRAQKTGALILAELGQNHLDTIRDERLNERDYGDLSGLNKDDARKKWGAEQVHQWRRSYDTPPPGGESLKDTAERVLPFFRSSVLPLVCEGKKVLVTAHGNSLRAVVMELDGLTREDVTTLNIATGDPLVYELDDKGRVLGKRSLLEDAGPERKRPSAPERASPNSRRSKGAKNPPT